MKNSFSKLFVLSVLVFLFCLSCASDPFAVPNPVLIPEDFFGITPGTGGNWETEDEKLLDGFNAVWVRSTIRWTDVEKEEGQWNFENWDRFVTRAEESGKKIILVIGFDSRWLYEDNKEHRNLTEKELPYFLKYVEQVAIRYRTRIVYEIWNEPNWLYWKGPAENFYPLSIAAVKKIREIEPNAIILAGSTSRVSERFTRGMAQSGALEDVDGFSLHPYAASPKGTIKQIEKLQKILDDLGYKMPIWITEVGYSTAPISFCNIKRYPEYIIKTLCGMAVRADIVPAIVWFELRNDYSKGQEPNRINPTWHFGLVYKDGTDKPGADAFRITARYLAGAEYRPEFPVREGITKNITSLYFIKPDGTNVLILWKNDAGKQKLRLSISGSIELIRHDINNGEEVLLATESLSSDDISVTLEVSMEPVFLTWMGEGKPGLSR